MATTVFPHNFFSENNVHEMIVLSSLHRIHILRYSVYCRLYTVRCKAGVFVFITLCDSWSSRVTEVRAREAFRCVNMKWESEEVGCGLNIPGRVVGGDYRCKEVVWVNAFMGGWLTVRTRHSWLMMSGPQQIQDFDGQCLQRLVVCYKGLPPEGKGGCNHVNWKEKKCRWLFCLSFISPVQTR